MLVTVKYSTARVAVALEIYRKDKGAYPKKLADLVPGLIESVPIDPYNGQPLQYQLSDDGKSYKLWSVGPDSASNAATVSYDPTNGTTSGGDISPR